MHFTRALILSLAITAGLSAANFTFTDPYGGQSNSNSNNGDVIGALPKFDIENVTIATGAGNTVTLTVRTNYNSGDTTLSGFPSSNNCCTLNIGDLMFRSGGSSWAVALATHGALTQANLYLVTGFLTAETVLGNPPGLIYRNNSNVWGNDAGAVKTNVGAGSRNVSLLGGNEVQVEVSFVADAAFYNAINSGNFSFEFASATCGNDVIDGSAVPEPVSMSLMGAGLLVLGLLRRTRFRFPFSR
ncbi:MAG: PEP-CTERM sorting domain-containing protein [Acidobacteria bacterium]|nr:PEP-CTERM sorting domain-containing protein [Acidobacteriota bacterium]